MSCCDTTVVELLDRIVPIEDEEISKELARVFKKSGIKCETGIKLDKIEKSKSGVKATGKNSKGADVTFEAEMMLVATTSGGTIQPLNLMGQQATTPFTPVTSTTQSMVEPTWMILLMAVMVMTL